MTKSFEFKTSIFWIRPSSAHQDFLQERACFSSLQDAIETHEQNEGNYFLYVYLLPAEVHTLRKDLALFEAKGGSRAQVLFLGKTFPDLGFLGNFHFLSYSAQEKFEEIRQRVFMQLGGLRQSTLALEWQKACEQQLIDANDYHSFYRLSWIHALAQYLNFSFSRHVDLLRQAIAQEADKMNSADVKTFPHRKSPGSEKSSSEMDAMAQFVFDCSKTLVPLDNAGVKNYLETLKDHSPALNFRQRAEVKEAIATTLGKRGEWKSA